MVRPLGKPLHRWEDNIKINFKESMGKGAIWIQLTRGRVQWLALVKRVMNLQVS
jgi:hypothetical protein